jgi:chorismate mutase/prephenate dehydratase
MKKKQQSLSKTIDSQVESIDAKIVQLLHERSTLLEIETDHGTKKSGTLKIAYLGPEHTYSHQAAVKAFPQKSVFSVCPNIPEIFTRVSKDEVDFGIVPAENLLEGSVNSTLDSFIRNDVYISGEMYLKIQHVLAVAPASSRGIKVIYSHPQALGQCRLWMLRNYPHVETIDTPSTSKAAQMVKNHPHTAAICNDMAADFYGLKVIDEHIQDASKNYTRFLIIGKKKTEATKLDKTSLVMVIPHTHGSLVKILDIFSKNKLNLFKIESRPSSFKAWEYVFYIDIEGHSSNPKVLKALKDVQKNSLMLKILGSYPQARIP